MSDLQWWQRMPAAPGAPGQEAAVSWQVRRTDGSPLACWETCTKDLYDLTLSTGRYCGFENGPPCEVRALGVIAAQEAAAVQAVSPLSEHWTIRRVDKDRIFVEAAGMASATVSVMSFGALEMLLAHMSEELLAALPPSGAGEKP